jgi:hypothetical protein
LSKNFLQETFVVFATLTHIRHSLENWRVIEPITSSANRVATNFILFTHFWPKEGLRPHSPAWPNHDHIFTVTSYVICGEISNREYDVSIGDGPWFLYSVEYGENITKLHPSSKASVTSSRTSRYQTGEFYDVAAGSFHQSEPMLGVLTSTLVLASKPGMGGPRVLGDGPLVQPYTCERRACSDTDYRSFLTDTLESVQSTGGLKTN